MKVKLLKDHLQSKAGDEIEVTEQRAAYWQRLGVIEGGETKSKAKSVEVPEKETKTVSQTNFGPIPSSDKKVKKSNPEVFSPLIKKTAKKK
jgi:hypothetical protein